MTAVEDAAGDTGRRRGFLTTNRSHTGPGLSATNRRETLGRYGKKICCRRAAQPLIRLICGGASPGHR